MKRIMSGAAAAGGHGMVALSMGTATPAYAESNYTVGQFNMAGGNRTHGKSKNNNDAPDALAQSVNARKPAWMTLQESCADWNGRLENKLPEYRIAFHTVQSSKGGGTAQCKHPSNFGNSVLFRKDFGFEPPERAKWHDLGSPSSFEQRGMLCIKAPAKKVAVCTIHLTNDDDKKRLKARRGEAGVAQKVLAGQEYAGYQIFLGGDLNDDPKSAVTDNFYHQGYGYGAHGSYKEVGSPCGNRIGQSGCRAGRPTHGGTKIDYIFVSPSVSVRSAEVGDAKHSDHRLLWSSISF